MKFLTKHFKKIDPYKVERLKVFKRSLLRSISKVANVFKDSRKIDKIDFYERVISYPLMELSRSNYSGGLIDSETYELIKVAVIQTQTICDIYTQNLLSDDIPYLEGNFLYGGIIFNHFGHFLIESLDKLWAYEFVKDLDPYICFGSPDFWVINFSTKSLRTFIVKSFRYFS